MRRWKFLCFLLLASLPYRPAAALNPERRISQYAHTPWLIQEGALTGIPSAIAQTTDGFVWIGTNLGLVRLDGARLLQWNPPAGQRLTDPRIFSLLGQRTARSGSAPATASPDGKMALWSTTRRSAVG